MKLSGDVEDKDRDLINPNVTPLDAGDLDVKISASLQIVVHKGLEFTRYQILSSPRYYTDSNIRNENQRIKI